jgi:hypothetical protein
MTQLHLPDLSIASPLRIEITEEEILADLLYPGDPR